MSFTNKNLFIESIIYLSVFFKKLYKHLLFNRYIDIMYHVLDIRRLHICLFICLN